MRLTRLPVISTSKTNTRRGSSDSECLTVMVLPEPDTLSAPYTSASTSLSRDCSRVNWNVSLREVRTVSTVVPPQAVMSSVSVSMPFTRPSSEA